MSAASNRVRHDCSNLVAFRESSGSPRGRQMSVYGSSITFRHGGPERRQTPRCGTVSLSVCHYSLMKIRRGAIFENFKVPAQGAANPRYASDLKRSLDSMQACDASGHTWMLCLQIRHLIFPGHGIPSEHGAYETFDRVSSMSQRGHRKLFVNCPQAAPTFHS